MLKNLSVFADLIKYKLSLAVVLSSATGYYLYSNTFDYHLIFLCAGVFFISSGSVALNQYTERKADSVMGRTRSRPIPSKRISEKRVLIICSFLFITGSFFLYLNGISPLFLGIFNVVLYNIIYTSLKKTTILSIIPGALVGAIPPMIGFISAGGTIFNPDIILFSGFMFLWQLPHFWLIIIKYGHEYRSAGFATISKYLNEIQIRYLVFFWILFSSGFLFLLFILNQSLNINLFFVLSFLNLSFIFLFHRLLFPKKGPQETKGAFILLNSLSFLIMILLIVASILKGL